MDIKDLIRIKQKQFEESRCIEFSDDEISGLDNSDAKKIIAHFQGHALLKLPPAEIEFFEWLKVNDNKVWNDIWDIEDNMYKVSIDFLTQLLDGRNGFPVCDLQDSANYYFTVRHIKPKGLEQMESVLAKLEKKEQLDVDELLLYDLHLAPTDIWHFAYTYNLPLKKTKKMIGEMEFKGWIVHLKESQDLLRYIEI